MKWPDLEQFLTDVAFAEIVAAEATHTLYVQPDQHDRAVWLVEQAGADHLVTVKAHPFLADDMWLLVDEQAIEADQREWQQHIRHRPLPMLFGDPQRPYFDPAHWRTGLGGWYQ